MKGFIVNRSHEEIKGKLKIFLYGRLENNESFVSAHNFEPYFYVRKKDVKIVEKINKKLKIQETDLTNFNKEKVVQIFFENQKILNEFAKELRDFNVETYEEDLKPEVRFLIEKNILDCIEIDGDFQENERVNKFYENPSIKPVSANINLKVASIDIESSKENGNLFCIGIHQDDVSEVFMITKNKIKGVVSCSSERECLEKFKERLIELDPDVITGWNVIDFDFFYLKKLFDEHKIPFDLGRNNRNPRLRIEKNFLKKSTMDIPGRIVLDGLNSIRDPFIKEAPSIKNIRFESYALEEVSEQIIQDTKILKGTERHDEIEQLYNGNQDQQKKLAEYNIKDCVLVDKILKKTKIIELAMERSSLTGMPLDKLTSSIASFDSLYIRNARQKGLVSPTSYFQKKSEKIKGGFVLKPKSGMYKNVLVLDFKSLYPSIIRTFNIDPASYKKSKEKDSIQSPNGAFFENTKGILPEIIGNLAKAREKAKQEKRELSSYAIKIIMNSFFGVLASPNSRYFQMDMGNAITNFGQEIIKLTKEKVNEKGFNVIYGDTDSIFVETGKNEKDSLELGKKIPEEINKFYKKYIKEKYSRDSFLELELDKLFLSLLILRTRDSESKTGAKKRYAGLVRKNQQQEIVITGLEAIRGDWTEAAQEFQIKLLMKVFKEEEPLKFIRDYIKDLKDGKKDKKLVYRKSIRKDLADYTKTTPPHVKAARKLEKLESNRIEYYQTLKGPEPIQNLTNKIDYEHYIEKQIKPIAKTILETVGLEPEKAFSETRQEKLF